MAVLAILAFLIYWIFVFILFPFLPISFPYTSIYLVITLEWLI